MDRLPTSRVIAGWMIALTGSAATIAIGANTIAAIAMGGLLSLFGGVPPSANPVGNAELIWSLLPAAAAAAANAWILWRQPPQASGISAWWMVPALGIALATLAFGIWACADVWQTPASAKG